jgi:hypothetical protein
MNFCPDLDIFDNRTLDDVFEEIKNDWDKGSEGIIDIQWSDWVADCKYGQTTYSKNIKACSGSRFIDLFTVISGCCPGKDVWHPISVRPAIKGSGADLFNRFLKAEPFCYHISRYFNSDEVKQAIRDLVAEPELLVTILHGREFSHDDLYNLFDFALTLFQKPHPWLHFSEGNKSKFIIVCNRLLGLPDSSLSMEVAMKETYGIDITNNLFFPLSGTIADSVQTFKLIKIDK